MKAFWYPIQFIKTMCQPTKKRKIVQPFCSLPKELIVHVFTYLPSSHLFQLGKSCKSMLPIVIQSVRESCVESFYKVLKHRNLAVSIEEQLSKKHHNLVMQRDYHLHLRSLIFNLQKNEILRKNIINGKVKPEQLINMSKDVSKAWF